MTQHSTALSLLSNNKPRPIEHGKESEPEKERLNPPAQKGKCRRKQAGRGNGRAKTEVDLRVIEVPQNLTLRELRLSLKHAVTILADPDCG